MTPKLQKSTFQFAIMFFAEITEELLEDIALLLAQIRGVVVFVDIAEIGEDMLCRSHVLVEVIEIREQDLSPSVEMVEGFVNSCTLGKALM